MQSVLLIEDDPALRNGVAGFLKESGFNVLCAEEGAGGIALYLKNPTALVITDLSMPGKDGFEVIRTLTSRFPGVRIIAISGAISGAISSDRGGCVDPLAEAMRLGAQIALPKPFAPRKLLDAIRVLME